MDRYVGWIIAVMAMLASGALGAFLYAWWHQKNEMAKRRIPRRWPLISRSMVNSKERRVWRWLIMLLSPTYGIHRPVWRLRESSKLTLSPVWPPRPVW